MLARRHAPRARLTAAPRNIGAGQADAGAGDDATRTIANTARSRPRMHQGRAS